MRYTQAYIQLNVCDMEYLVKPYFSMNKNFKKELYLGEN